MTTITWVQDSNSNYEISSKEHLIQLMNTGGTYTDAGTPPTDYLSSSYIQTTHIDLQADSNIKPIKIFTGQYDGQEYSISNWAYTTIETNVGLFGQTSGAIIQNIVLDGVWILLNTDDGAFLVGVSANSQIYNIRSNFSPGTRIVARIQSIGGFIGFCTSGGTIQNLTLGGTIDEFSGARFTGGVIGFNNGTSASYIRNMATFTTGITNTEVGAGGVFGHCNGTSTHILNAMNGNITSPSYAGGVYGRLTGGVTDAINSMLGNVTSTGISAGIAANVTGSSFTRCLNYMKGDVTNCLFGSMSSATLSKCVVAMDGTAINAVYESGSVTSSEVLLDTTFGLVVSNTANTQTTMDTSSFDGISANGLPFISFSFTDNASNTIDWQTTFFGEIYVPPLTVIARSINIVVILGNLDGVIGNRVTIEGPTGGEIIRVTDTLEQHHNFVNIDPDTQYTIRLYLDTGSGYVLSEQSSVTTVANVSANYDISDFEEDGIVKISKLRDDARLSTVINDLFNTGDIVEIETERTDRALFVKRGETLNIKDIDSALLPFSGDLGAGQTVNFVLSDDSTTVPVIYDETNDNITVNTVTYGTGQSFLFDGRKATVYDF